MDGVKLVVNELRLQTIITARQSTRTRNTCRMSGNVGKPQTACRSRIMELPGIAQRTPLCLVIPEF